MRKTINDKFFDHLNEEFRTSLPAALTKKFGDLGFKTEYNLFVGSMGGLVTGWKKKVTPSKRKAIEEFLLSYEEGFNDAANRVYYFNRKQS